MPDPTHIGDLVPDSANARRHTPRNIGMIERSLNEVGAARSGVIDEDNVILAGNGLVEAAAQAGIVKVKVVDADGETIVMVRRSDLTPGQKKLLSLYDNRTAELAEWDEQALAILQQDSPAILDELFSKAELDALLASGASDLDKLASENGEPGAEDFWPEIKLKVHPETFQAYRDLLERLGKLTDLKDSRDAERFRAMVEISTSALNAAEGDTT
jgi:hypothetical protein